MCTRRSICPKRDLTVEEPTLSTPAADVAHLLRRAGFEGTAAEIASFTTMELPAIVDTLLDFTPNPVDTPPPSLADPTKGDWERMQDLIQWWLDRMATIPCPLQEKLALFWHGHFCTQYCKVGSAQDMYDQNHCSGRPAPVTSRASRNKWRCSSRC